MVKQQARFHTALKLGFSFLYIWAIFSGCASSSKLSLQAMHEYEQGNIDKAVERWLKVASKDSTLIEAYFGLSLCANKGRNYESALMYINKAIDYSRHHPEGWLHHRAQIYLTLANISGLTNLYRLDLLNRSITDHPTFVPALLARAETYYEIACEARAQKQLDSAIEYLTRALNDHSTFNQARLERSEAYFENALLAYDRSELEIVIESLTLALADQPSHLAASKRRSDVYLELAKSELINYRPQKALILLEKSVADNPHNGQARNTIVEVSYNLAQKQYDKGDYLKAVKYLDTSLAYEPTFHEAYVERSSNFYKLARKESSSKKSYECLFIYSKGDKGQSKEQESYCLFGSNSSRYVNI